MIESNQIKHWIHPNKNEGLVTLDFLIFRAHSNITQSRTHHATGKPQVYWAKLIEHFFFVSEKGAQT